MAISSAAVDLVARDRVTGVTARVQAVLLKVEARMKAVAAAARLMLMVSTGVIAGLVYLAAKQSAEENKLANVLKATGNAAGYSSKELKQMASDFQMLTAFGDETTLAMMSILATFKEIKGDQFRDATEAAMDLSVVMGQDLKSSATQLGKALNDPVKGVTALQRVGVSFTQSQRDMIAEMQGAGDIMGAQNLILEELRSQFGGAARGELKEAAGQFKALKNDIGDMGEKLGVMLIPMTLEFLKVVKILIEKTVEWVKANEELVVRWLKIGMAILAVLIILPKLVTAIRVVTSAIVWMKALSGPVGWAQLATGAAVAAGSILALGVAYNKMNKEIQVAISEAKKLSAQQKKDAADRLRQHKEVARATGPEGKSEEQTAFEKHLEKINKYDVEINKRRRTFGMTAERARRWELSIPLGERHKGVLDDLDKQIDALERLEHRKKKMGEGSALTESLRKPIEVFRDDMQKYRGLLMQKAIDEETFARATADARKKYMDTLMEDMEPRWESLTGAWKRIQTEMARGPKDDEKAWAKRNAEAAEGAHRQMANVAKLQGDANKLAEKNVEVLEEVREKVGGPGKFGR